MTLHERLQKLIENGATAHDLASFARLLKEEGNPQTKVYELFDDFRAVHENDSDETIYENVLDTMDFISGYCAPTSQLFDQPDDAG